MASLPQLKRFLQEDFPDQPWIGKLFYPLNLFMNAVYSALNNSLTFQDNLLSQIKTLSVNGSSPTVQFTWKFSTNPVGVLILRALDSSSSPTVVTSAVTCDWSFSSGVVTINNITGLTAGKTYSVTFLVIGG